MARTHARVVCQIWNDPHFMALSREEQRMFLLLLSQPDLSLCGVLFYRPKRWARLSPRETVKTVEATIRLLEDEHYVIIDHDTDELWIRTFIKWDGILQAHGHMQKAMWNALDQVMSEAIRKAFHEVFNELKSGGFVKERGVGVGEGEGGRRGPKVSWCKRCGLSNFDCVCAGGVGGLSAVPNLGAGA